MYKNQDGKIVRLSDSAFIPNDPENTDWLIYQDWLLMGNQPSNETTPEAKPQSVTMKQARKALLEAGLLDSVDAAIAAMPNPPRDVALIEWNYSNEVQRHNGFVSQLGPLLGLTEEQIDTLFERAAAL